jgi:hypothetical protein
MMILLRGKNKKGHLIITVLCYRNKTTKGHAEGKLQTAKCQNSSSGWNTLLRSQVISTHFSPTVHPLKNFYTGYLTFIIKVIIK